MKKCIVIEKRVILTRIALFIEDTLKELDVITHLNEEKQNQIVIGQVVKIMPHLKAAFVDIGDEKNGLLHLKQVPSEYLPLHEGKRVPVQIVKRGIGDKGDKLTGMINITGRYAVYLPFEKGINLSKKIIKQEERQQLKEIAEQLSTEYGVIIRTQAKDMPSDIMKEHMKQLLLQTEEIMRVRNYLDKGTVLYCPPPRYIEVILENLQDELKIVCDDEVIFQMIEKEIAPYKKQYNHLELVLTEKKENLFSAYDIEKLYENLFQRKIWLKNGGNLVIDTTEAMTVIDINSAKAIQTKNHTKAVKKLNEIAVKEAILQVIRRNIAGIIIIDLVDMSNELDKEAIYRYAYTVLNSLQEDRTKIYPVTPLGLLQMSRTKKYKSIQEQLTKECRICQRNAGTYHPDYLLFLIEKQIRDTYYHTTNNALYIYIDSQLQKYIEQEKVLEKWQECYPISILLLPMEKNQKKQFICRYSPQ